MEYTITTAPWNVIKGTTTFGQSLSEWPPLTLTFRKLMQHRDRPTALLGGVTGSTIGVVRNLPALPAAFTTAINTGMFSFSFFSQFRERIRDPITRATVSFGHPLLAPTALREYAIIPILTVNQLHPDPLDPDASASWNPHFYNLLPTSLAGFTAGSFFSYVMRATSRASVRAGVTLSLGCTTLQSVFNEVELLRIRAVLRSELRERARLVDEEMASVLSERRSTPALTTSPAVPATPATPSSTTTASVHQTSPDRNDYYAQYPNSSTARDPKTETFAARSDRLFSSAWTSFQTTLARWSPVKKLDQEEYERLLMVKLQQLPPDTGRDDDVRRERQLLEEKIARARERR
ncbi:BZ3500_MvSof-1268-A1-R1_Chr9g10567 [Microbotryum saponariae]|uniref:BZ3500_MvSof-1268-A1-R1_Chr9g10567 protein n=1 Tax=Microbotryum saponariae TaxID=289078 RepID=A0A2X0KBJ7_9BASI|nr:BZ3501_MvSof-1269-A2-R1_Chr9g10316 [Microbotryum saponariae]SDA00309.1 BZ3500_MvSof-1268-A1-R1_Chr9g10567 [Microbotryum saponariae]